MTLVTRTITNAGAPLVSPAGALLPNTLITFTLVSTIGLPANTVGLPAHAVDAFTQHDVASVPITTTTDAQGEFSVALWPTSRGDRPVRYRVVVDRPGITPFTASLADGITDLSWAAFMAGGTPLTPAEVSQLELHLAEINAQKLAAEQAAQAAAGSAGTAHTDALAADAARALAEGEAADALAARIAAEAAATQAAFSTGVTQWVSGATYARDVQVWSPANYVTYRRIVAGTGTTDPSADLVNWAPIWASVLLARDLGRARYRRAYSGDAVQAGAIYDVDTTAAPATLFLPRIAETEVGDAIEFLSYGGAWGAPYALVLARRDAGIYIQGSPSDFAVNYPVPGIALICKFKTATQAWWSIV